VGTGDGSGVASLLIMLGVAASKIASSLGGGN